LSQILKELKASNSYGQNDPTKTYKPVCVYQ